MSLISWNCHGIGTPWASQFLREIVLQKRPDFIFLCETLCKTKVVEKLRKMLNFEGMIVVEASGHSGGLAFLWRFKDTITLRSYSKNNIDVNVSTKDGFQYRLTGIYGEPDRSKREETWNLLRHLYGNNNYPWCLVGDMNNVLTQRDKRGGRPYPERLLSGFQDTLHDCNLVDLNLCGYQFTWERGLGTPNHIEVRLDRALVNHNFLQLFQDVRLTNLEVSTSDHSPIWLEPVQGQGFIHTKKFRFENAWLREPLCLHLVEEVWCSTEDSLYTKLARCSEILSDWGKEYTGCFKKRINNSKRLLKQLKGRTDSNSLRILREEKQKLTEIYVQQEVFWRQRSKQLWLREGDQNSRYLHTATKIRRKSNHIERLLDNQGNIVRWGHGLEQTVETYFQELFTASNTDWRRVTDQVSSRVTTEQNVMLLAEVTEKEVKAALFAMHPDKSSGPDGMTPGFYQKCWPIVKHDVVSLVQQFFTSGRLDVQLQQTNIALIPKKPNSELMTDIRPISLCNVLYKVISKVLANRLKLVIDSLISDAQNAFIHGRLISDNIMIAFEIMHYMKRKTQGKDSWMALKLDMSKAYDRVEWSYMEAMLLRLGFNSHVVLLFMTCLSSVTYSIAHAGRYFGTIVPSRGLRQGDPLSSYLFLICMEGLSSLLQDFERHKYITGIKVARTAPSISHMFFADDSYIFCKANMENANHILSLLHSFEVASGQKINSGKSSIFFSKNAPASLKYDLCMKLNYKEASEYSSYLGLPNIVGRNKTAVFGFIKDKLKTKIQGWEQKCLSKGGKEILLKTVAQTLPNYVMSVFLLPMDLCQQFERLMCKFWWQSNSKKDRSIHWQDWQKMCRRKSMGGMGFRNVHDFNLALLGKQGWRLLKFHYKLVSKVYKARYFPTGSYLNAALGHNPSFFWRSIWEAQNLIRKGTGCRVGNGKSISIVSDPWLPVENDAFIHTDNEAFQNQMVSSLMSPDSNTWDSDLILDMFNSRDSSIILSLPIDKEAEDSWYWRREKFGNYSVKSAYLLIEEEKTASSTVDNFCFWCKLWNLKLPPKVKNFLWRACTDCLPTKDLLKYRKVPVNPVCAVCNMENESIFHILVRCSHASTCLAKIDNSLIIDNVFSFLDWLAHIFQLRPSTVVHKTAMVCWMIWKSRNDLIWNQISLAPNEVVVSACSVLDQWRNVQDRTFDRFLGYMKSKDGDEHWTLPNSNSIKINTDAAIFKEINRYSIAFVVRDFTGSLIEARTKSWTGSVTAEMAEIIGVREALRWVQQSSFSDITLESDCLSMVQAVRSSFLCYSYLGRLVSECRKLLANLHHKNIQFRFVKRSANQAAHYLARGSRSIVDRVWKVGDVHLDFQHVLLQDLQV